MGAWEVYCVHFLNPEAAVVREQEVRYVLGEEREESQYEPCATKI